ncbi:Uncharacterised protein [Vibrio cholerae]|nr:Uncharacterised protein [Vibrio cholerae]
MKAHPNLVGFFIWVICAYTDAMLIVLSLS